MDNQDKPELPHTWTAIYGKPLDWKRYRFHLIGIFAPFWLPLLFAALTYIANPFFCNILSGLAMPLLATVILLPLWCIFTVCGFIGGILITPALFVPAFLSVLTLGWIGLANCGGH